MYEFAGVVSPPPESGMSTYLQGAVARQSDLGLFAQRDRFDNTCKEEAMSFRCELKRRPYDAGNGCFHRCPKFREDRIR